MDEPFSGLDPINTALLKEAFLELRDRGKAIVFSTHQMEAVEELCDAVAIIDHGRLVCPGRRRTSSGRRAGASCGSASRATRGLDWLDTLPDATVRRSGLRLPRD